LSLVYSVREGNATGIKYELVVRVVLSLRKQPMLSSSCDKRMCLLHRILQ